MTLFEICELLRAISSFLGVFAPLLILKKKKKQIVDSYLTCDYKDIQII